MKKYLYKNKYFIFTGLLSFVLLLNIYFLNLFVRDAYKIFFFNTNKIYYTNMSSFTSKLQDSIINNLEKTIKKVKLKYGFEKQNEFKFEDLYLFFSETSKNTLETNLPDTATYKYEDGYMLYNSKINEIDFRYRGDNNWHFINDKKSLKIKTKKKSLYKKIWKFNIIAPKTDQQLNNILAYQLATELQLLSPKQYPVRLHINNNYHGLYYFVEQIDESFLRNRFLMPGDIYVGEGSGFKDSYMGIWDENHLVKTLFTSADPWHKSAINNHFDDDNKDPLRKLIYIINNNTYKSKKELSNLLDLESWATFAIYKSLLITYHFDKIHNWKLYYDPWKQMFFPIVWDPMGFRRQFNQFGEILHLKIMQELFRNGDFLEIYFNKINFLNESGMIDRIHENIKNTVDDYLFEVNYDPNLHSSNVEKVEQNIAQLLSNVNNNFGEFKKRYKNSLNSNLFFSQDTKNSVIISGLNKNLYDKFEIEFYDETSLNSLTNVSIEHDYNVYDETFSHSTILPITRNGKNRLYFNFDYFPNLKISKLYYEKDKYFKKSKLVDYQSSYLKINFNKNISVKNIVLHGSSKKSIRLVKNTKSIDNQPFFFTTPQSNINSKKIILTGENVFEENKTFNEEVIIMPGTILKLKSGVSLFFNNSVSANGSFKKPIKVLSNDPLSLPWGTFGINNAETVNLNHVHFDNGSGYKDSTKEYSAMLSIHNVKEFTLRNCKISNSFIVDDMLHVVYSNGSVINSSFQNSFADAIDIDISKVIFDGLKVENAGNDGLDLMSSEVIVSSSTITSSKDKGISVGENSYVSVYNSDIKNNFKGIEVKDGSKAIIDSTKIIHNNTDISAYKKNWRYGSPGYLFFVDSDTNLNNISLKDNSQIYIDKNQDQNGINTIINPNNISKIKKIKNYDLFKNDFRNFMKFVDNNTKFQVNND